MVKKRMKDQKKLRDIGELNLIRGFRSQCSVTAPDVVLGIGDDAAAFRVKAGTGLVTSDMMIEGIHFDISLTTFYQLGYKILAVNLSDIFAMGGIPRFFLLNLGIPASFSKKDVDELYSGVMKIAEKFGVSIVGGDTCASKNGLVLSGTLIGSASKMISRSGARPGDGIFVTGVLGDSAMGLKLLKNMGRNTLRKLRTLPTGRQVSDFGPCLPARFAESRRAGRFRIEKTKKTYGNSVKVRGKTFVLQDVLYLIKKHLMPEPLPLKRTSGITSMIDVSDGLIMDLSHICDESRVGAVLYSDRIPVSGELRNAAHILGVDYKKTALYGGEDYGLLFTAPRKGNMKNAVRVGEITKKGRYLIDAKGRKHPFKAKGYEHFR
jgi:thiamine-monophosphate kinase